MDDGRSVASLPVLTTDDGRLLASLPGTMDATSLVHRPSSLRPSSSRPFVPRLRHPQPKHAPHPHPAFDKHLASQHFRNDLLVRYNPRPVPGVFIFRCDSRRTNELKSSGRSASAMPMPVSVTVITMDDGRSVASLPVLTMDDCSLRSL